MFRPLTDRFARAREQRRGRRAEEGRREDAFLEECRARVERWAVRLRTEGVAEWEFDAGDEAPPSITLTPTRSDAAEVWIGFDYPTFCITLPHPGRPAGYYATAELFGTREERLIELERRLEAIVEGRLSWRYRSSSGCVLLSWLAADGVPFLKTAYSGAHQGDAEASGQTAPFRV